MNDKGYMFTLAVLILILAIIGLNSQIKDLSGRFSGHPELAALEKTDAAFRNIERSMVMLDLNNGKKEILEKGLPFSYVLRSPNSVVLSQRLPVNGVLFANYFDAINAAEIFFEQSDANAFLAGLVVDVNAVKNPAWGGSSSFAQFALEPSCISYRIDPNSASVGSAFPRLCAGQFNPLQVRVLDINLRIDDSLSDFNRLLCNGGLCPTNVFNPLDPNPFLSVAILDQNCTNCQLVQKTLSTHFDPSVEYTVILACQGAACLGKSVTMQFGSLAVIQTDSNQVMDLNIALDLNSPISSFWDQDFNYSVTYPRFGIIRTGNPQTLPAG